MATPGGDDVERQGRPVRRAAVALVALALVLVAALSQVVGVRHLFDSGVDLRKRWQEASYVAQGDDPFAVWTNARADLIDGPSDPPRTPNVDPRLGDPGPGGYPPWSFFLGQVFALGDESIAKWTFLFLNTLASIALMVAFVRCVGPPDRLHAVALAAGVVATNGGTGTWYHGQYGTIVVALLFWSVSAPWSRDGVRTGLLAGLAQVKPTLALPFLAIPLLRRWWRALLVVAGIVVAGSAWTWHRTGVDPVTMLGEASEGSRSWVGAGDGLLDFVMRNFSGSPSTPRVVFAVVAVTVTAAMWWRRDRSPLELGALAGLGARLCTYHKRYDNVILLPLAAALLHRAYRRPTALPVTLCVLVAVSLLAPSRVAVLAEFRLFQHVTWVVSALYLLFVPPPAGAASGSARETAPTDDGNRRSRNRSTGTSTSRDIAVPTANVNTK